MASDSESGAGALCRGPGNMGGQLVVAMTYRGLCEGEWASMKGFAPRLPVELVEDHEEYFGTGEFR